MITLKGTMKNGQLVFDGPVDLPEGARVDVTLRTAPEDKIGLDPSEWREDEAVLEDWAAWIATFEAVETTTEEEADLQQFRQSMKLFNIEAVRRQMEDGEP